MNKFQKFLLGISIISFMHLFMSCSQTKNSQNTLNKISTFKSVPDTFEEFEKTVYKEPFDNGIYIVNGDTPIENIKELEIFYHQLISIKEGLSKNHDLKHSPRKLIIEKFEDSTINKWSHAQKLELTYCISKSTAGSSYRRVIGIMDDAAAAWEEAANIDFIHLSEYDEGCDEQTNEVLFNVRLRYGIPYEARSFFPGQSRETRNILINSGYIYQSNYLTGLLKHELGHVLGFRHEHIRQEANSPSEPCMDYGYGYFQELTEYDSDSVMHYPHCNGTAESFEITDLDIEGARKVYGAPGEDPVEEIVGEPVENPIEEPIDDPIVDDPVDDPIVEPVNDPIIPENKTETLLFTSENLPQGEKKYYKSIPVIPGTQLFIKMTGTGDADIYVKFDLHPDLYSYDTRAYTPNSNENITMNVPALAERVYIMVNGYKDSTYDLEINYAIK